MSTPRGSLETHQALTFQTCTNRIVPTELNLRYTSRGIPLNVAWLAGMVAYMDDAMGEMVDALVARNLWERTLIVFISDNGGAVRSIRRVFLCERILTTASGYDCRYKMALEITFHCAVQNGHFLMEAFVFLPLCLAGSCRPLCVGQNLHS